MHTVDFMEIYSPTPEALCVKTVVAVAVERDWEQRQLDVKQAFIQADLDYDVYMKLSDQRGTHEAYRRAVPLYPGASEA